VTSGRCIGRALALGRVGQQPGAAVSDEVLDDEG
jgi:hypothetical protein